MGEYVVDRDGMFTTSPIREALAAAADLAFGSRCAGCDEELGTLCDACAETLYGPATEGEIGAVPLAVTMRYEGVGRAVVLAHKERGRLSLAQPLGAALAVAVTAALTTSGPVEKAVLVPAPSRRSATRARGHDPMMRTARHAARVLDRAGIPTVAVPALAYRRTVSDQHDLDRDARFANVAGAISVRRWLLGRFPRARVVVVDDVVTTGATVLECCRSLERAGRRPTAVAAITATGGRRR